MTEPIVVQYMVVPEDEQNQPVGEGVKTSFVLVDPEQLELVNEGGFFLASSYDAVVHHISIYALPEDGGALIARVQPDPEGEEL